jgi:predicted phage baseplate assembly protein
VLIGVHLHTTDALQGATVRSEILGHGDGTPHQEFRLSSAPTLGGITVVAGDGGERWREVDSLAFSRRDARDFEFHPSSGIVRFGDGEKGRMPTGPVRAIAYRTGGGSRGNVGPGAISVMRRAIPGIDAVSNPYRAEGGVDPEGMDEAVARALRDFRCRGRAVTEDDFETLSLEASRWVARAWCRSAGAGEVTVIILPRPAPGRRTGDPIFTPRALIDEVRRYLVERSLVTTTVRCRGPSYREVMVEITVVPTSTGATPAILADRLEDRIREHLDPIAGGERGWSPGRPLTRADIHAALSPLDEVDYLEEVHISPGGSRLDLDPHVLPVLARARVRIARREP